VIRPDGGKAQAGATAPGPDAASTAPAAGKAKAESAGPVPAVDPQAAARAKPEPSAAVPGNDPLSAAPAATGAEAPATPAPGPTATATKAAASDIRIESPPAPTGSRQPAAAGAPQGVAGFPVPTAWPLAASAATAPADRAVPIAGLAVEIASRAQDGQRSFEIRLDPPDLGRIAIQLNVDSTGHVTSHLVADRPDTLDLLRRDAPSLERALQSAGLKTDDGGMQFSLRDQSSFAGGQQAQRDSTAAVARIVVPDPELPPVDTAVRGYGRVAGIGSGVDIRV
jgi:chemotaxis protein MotD